ncbi:hypothetical protein QJS10_CPB12g00375 [Acorus calamus]|uniref:Uncharacterized protein n=1 Tax=Acorus calamus TaxID=4465 RepID=A0AAV9DPY6_ACOCL|nr:hypothetical protein QJS10_CPB12g00375 [Acorus calamus]
MKGPEIGDSKSGPPVPNKKSNKVEVILKMTSSRSVLKARIEPRSGPEEEDLISPPTMSEVVEWDERRVPQGGPQRNGQK